MVGGGGLVGDPMIECSFGKVWKIQSPRCPKNTFSEAFCIKFYQMA